MSGVADVGERGLDAALEDLGLTSFVLRGSCDGRGLPPGFRDTAGGLVCAGNATRTDGVLVVHGASLGAVDSIVRGRPLGVVGAADAARLHLECFHCRATIRGAPQFIKDRSGRVNTTPFCSTACRVGHVMHTRDADPDMLHSIWRDLEAYGVPPGNVHPSEPTCMLRQHGGSYTSRDLRTRRGAGVPGHTVGDTVTHHTAPNLLMRYVTSAPKSARARGVFSLDAANAGQMFPENHGVAHGLRRLEVEEAELSRPVRLAEGPMMAFYIARRQRVQQWMRDNPDVMDLVRAAEALHRDRDRDGGPGDGEHKGPEPDAWPREPMFEPGRLVELARTPDGSAALQRASGRTQEEVARATQKLSDRHESFERELRRDFPMIACVMDPTGIAARRAEKQERRAASRKAAAAKQSG